MEDSEKLTALKKAYADIILNTAKEAAARIMVSERKASRFQQELVSTKEEALQMLLRLKQMFDSKIFGSDPSCADYLKSLIEALFQHTTRLLTNIQEFTARPDIADDCFLLASRCIRYCPQLFIPSSVFPSLVDCSMIGITVQHREASNSILHFLADIFDLANSSVGEQFIPIRDGVIIPRGASITRILVASLTGALPKSRVDVVSYTLLALTRSYGMQALEWAKKSVLLIPSTAVTDVERSRFLKALSDAASGGDTNGLTVPVEELSDVCRRNRSVQEIVQEALRPLELNMVNVS